MHLLISGGYDGRCPQAPARLLGQGRAMMMQNMLRALVARYGLKQGMSSEGKPKLDDSQHHEWQP